jgi:hypothetical protein
VAIGSFADSLARGRTRFRPPVRRASPRRGRPLPTWTTKSSSDDEEQLTSECCSCTNAGGAREPIAPPADASVSSNSRAWRAATHAPPFVAEAGVTVPARRALCLVRCDRERGAPRPLQTGRMRQSWSRAGATSGGAAEVLTCRVVGWSPGEHGGGGEGRLRHRGRQELEPGKRRGPRQAFVFRLCGRR